MKKTLIALMALAGVACGAATTGTSLTEAWQKALTDANYTVDGDFTYSLDFTLTGGIPYYSNTDGSAQSATNILTLSDDYYLISQGHTYWGLNSAASNAITGQGYTFSKNDDSTLFTYTGSSDGVRPITWVRNADNNNSGTRGLGSGASLGFSVNVAYDGKNTSITLSYGGSDITDKFVITNAELDATEFVLYSGATVSDSNISVAEIPAVPEPATATLSLLALAGLAARRRRH